MSFFIFVSMLFVLTGFKKSADDTELLSVVMVSRHGIRSLHIPLEDFNKYTQRPQGFPVWPPPADVPGNLSAKGKENVTKLGSWYRDFYASQGLLPARGNCPPDGKVFVYANVMERTIQTAQGYINGLFKDEKTADCGVKVIHAEGETDPYFTAASVSGLCKTDSTRDLKAFNDAVGGNPDSLKIKYSSRLRMMQDVTKCCAPEACQTVKNPKPSSCTLMELPSAPGIHEKTGIVKFDTLFHVASGIAETLELEYVEGMAERKCPTAKGAQCFGWGAVPPGGLNEMMSLETMYFNVVHRLPSFVQASASNLMWQVIGTMDQTLSGVKNPAALAPAGNRLTIFVGHDVENITAIGAFLDVNWQVEGFQQNDPAPTGALVFELHRNKKDGRNIVRLFYVVPSLEQMRSGAVLTLKNPPQRVRLTIPACGTLDCPYEKFKNFIITNVRQDCITRTLPKE